MAQITKEGNRWLVNGPMSMPHVESLLAESVALDTAKEVEIDLSSVSEVDTATISLLFEWLRMAHNHKCKVHYTNLPENLASLAKLYGVLELIPLAAPQTSGSTSSH